MAQTGKSDGSIYRSETLPSRSNKWKPNENGGSGGYWKPMIIRSTGVQLKFIISCFAHVARYLTFWVPENSEYAVLSKFNAYKRLTSEQFELYRYARFILLSLQIEESLSALLLQFSTSSAYQKWKYYIQFHFFSALVAWSILVCVQSTLLLDEVCWESPLLPYWIHCIHQCCIEFGINKQYNPPIFTSLAATKVE